MLRTLVFALATLAAPSAAGEEFPHSALHAEVVGPEGTTVGRVAAVERDAEGRIVAVEIPGLEPPDAPAAPDPLIAERRRARAILAAAEARRAQAEGAGRLQALR